MEVLKFFLESSIKAEALPFAVLLVISLLALNSGNLEYREDTLLTEDHDTLVGRCFCVCRLGGTSLRLKHLLDGLVFCDSTILTTYNGDIECISKSTFVSVSVVLDVKNNLSFSKRFLKQPSLAIFVELKNDVLKRHTLEVRSSKSGRKTIYLVEDFI